MRSLTIVERYGQVTVTTSDGRKASGATLVSALEKLWPDDFTPVTTAFKSIEPSPDGGQIHEGPMGA